MTPYEGSKRYPARLDFAIFAYIKKDNHITSRMFAPLDNIPEDPATESASATLTAVLTDILETPQTLSFLQGEDMGRPSYIYASSTHDPLSVSIKEQAVQTMAGRLML